MRYWQGNISSLNLRERQAVAFADELLHILPTTYDRPLPIQLLCRIYDTHNCQIDKANIIGGGDLNFDSAPYVRRLETIFGNTRNLSVGDITVTSAALCHVVSVFMDWQAALPRHFNADAVAKIEFYREHPEFIRDIEQGTRFKINIGRSIRLTP